MRLGALGVGSNTAHLFGVDTDRGAHTARGHDQRWLRRPVQFPGVSPDRPHQVPASPVAAQATMRALDVPCVRIYPQAVRERVILRRLDSLGGS